MSKPEGGCKQYSRNKDKCLGIGCTWCGWNFRNKCRWEPGPFVCVGRKTAGLLETDNLNREYNNNEQKKENRSQQNEQISPNRPSTTFAGICVEKIYEKLFNMKLVDQNGKTTLTLLNGPLPSCFQDGAFLFEDVGGYLFDLLAFGTGLQGQQSSTQREMKCDTLTSMGTQIPLTHLMPYLPEGSVNSKRLIDQLRIIADNENIKLEKDGKALIQSIDIEFHNIDNNTTPIQVTMASKEYPVAAKFAKAEQYERKITGTNGKKISIDCGYGDKQKEKGIIKFYSYSVIFKVPYSKFKIQKRFTFVKLESTTALSPSGAVHHAARQLEKTAATYNKKSPQGSGEELNSLISAGAIIEAKCQMKKDQKVCYRAEDVVLPPNDDEYPEWKTTYNPNEPEWYKDYRVGQEYFVPQRITGIIISAIDNYNGPIEREARKLKYSEKHKRVGGRRNKTHKHKNKTLRRKTRKRRKKKTRRKKRKNRKKRTRKR